MAERVVDALCKDLGRTSALRDGGKISPLPERLWVP